MLSTMRLNSLIAQMKNDKFINLDLNASYPIVREIVKEARLVMINNELLITSKGRINY